MSPFSLPFPRGGGFFHAPISVQGHSMKQRATVLCRRGGRILLVARPDARWVLPGGGPHRGESPIDAARRASRTARGNRTRLSPSSRSVQRGRPPQVPSRLRLRYRRRGDRASRTRDCAVCVDRPSHGRIDQLQPTRTSVRLRCSIVNVTRRIGMTRFLLYQLCSTPYRILADLVKPVPIQIHESTSARPMDFGFICT